MSTWYFHQIQVGMWAKLWDMSHLFACIVALVITRWRHTSKRPVCRHCSNLQAPKHYLIRAANYLLAQNGSKNSNIVNLVLVYNFLRSLCFMVRYPIPERFLISDTELLRRNFSSRTVFPIKFQFGIKLIFYLRSKVLNNCNRLSYMIFESRKCPELGTIHTILGSW